MVKAIEAVGDELGEVNAAITDQFHHALNANGSTGAEAAANVDTRHAKTPGSGIERKNVGGIKEVNVGYDTQIPMGFTICTA